MKNDLEPWKTMKNDLEPWKIMKTNLEPEKRYFGGVTTDLGGARGRNNGKTLPTRGHNRPLDLDSDNDE